MAALCSRVPLCTMSPTRPLSCEAPSVIATPWCVPVQRQCLIGCGTVSAHRLFGCVCDLTA